MAAGVFPNLLQFHQYSSRRIPESLCHMVTLTCLVNTGFGMCNFVYFGIKCIISRCAASGSGRSLGNLTDEAIGCLAISLLHGQTPFFEADVTLPPLSPFRSNPITPSAVDSPKRPSFHSWSGTGLFFGSILHWTKAMLTGRSESLISKVFIRLLIKCSPRLSSSNTHKIGERNFIQDILTENHYSAHFYLYWNRSSVNMQNWQAENCTHNVAIVACSAASKIRIMKEKLIPHEVYISAFSRTWFWKS